jgi:peptide/nickel transport system substrate-binding protein
MSLLTQARQTLDVTERTNLMLKAQSIWEPAQTQTTLVNQSEVSYLKNGLAGMETSWYYFSIPALALIGAAQ